MFCDIRDFTKLTETLTPYERKMFLNQTWNRGHLHYYLAHCDAWINNPNGTWEVIQRWDDVHVFTEK